MLRIKYPRSKYLDALMADAYDVTEVKTAVSISCKSCTRRRRISFNSCARRRRARYLPQEVFFEFLSHLPAQVLNDVMRHVCKEWNLIIRSRDFIHHHLRNSTTGILIKEWSLSTENMIYVEMRRGCVEISKLDCVLKELLWASCNGLLLTHDLIDRSIFYVTNPLTKQRVAVPPYLHKIKCFEFGLAFCEASMEYKVVCLCGEYYDALKTRIDVLTVGVDKVWRCIDIKHLQGVVRRGPLVTGGYVHWIGETFVLTLNVETEAVFHFSLPQLIVSNKCGKFLAMGSNLSFFCQTSKFLRDVWELNPKTGEWIMMLRMDLKPVRYIFKKFSQIKNFLSILPYGWLVVREVLLFSDWYPTRHCIAYNLKTREIQLIELGTDAKRHHFRDHVNSFSWFR